MESSVSGIKVRGDWKEVVDLGQRVSVALRSQGVEEGALGDAYALAFKQWEAWRPKPPEELEDEVRAKTSAQAATPRGRGERAGRSAGEDVKDAGRSMGEAGDELANGGGLGEAARKVGQGIARAARAADTAGRKAMRRLERAVFEGVMTRTGPLYFDNELVSANLSRVNGGEVFFFEVNVNDDELKARVAERLDAG